MVEMFENVSAKTWKIVAVAGAAVVGAFVLFRVTRTDPEVERRRNVIRSHFPRFSEAEVRELAENAVEKYLVAGDQPIMEGELSPNVFIIRSGEFELFKYQKLDNSYPLVGVAGKGQSLGLECTFGHKGECHAKATSDAVVWQIPTGSFTPSMRNKLVGSQQPEQDEDVQPAAEES